jgi:hypothetical protein
MTLFDVLKRADFETQVHCQAFERRGVSLIVRLSIDLELLAFSLPHPVCDNDLVRTLLPCFFYEVPQAIVISR